MKTCIQCAVLKAEDQFYRHAGMGDGTLNKCKQCCIEYAKNRRKNFPDAVKEIDKRKSQTKSRKKWAVEYQRKSRSLNHEKYYARTKVGNALRDGRLVKQPCIKCGSLDVQAHHTDYSQPLNVVWLCIKHHFDEHKLTHIDQ